MIYNIKNSRYFFSTNKRKYDLICLGPLAEKTARLIERSNKKLTFQKLFIKENNIKHEYSLTALNQIQFPLKNHFDNNEKTDTILRNQLKSINPSQSCIVLQNDEKIHYSHLIFTGNDIQWKNHTYYQELSNILATPLTSVFSDTPLSINPISQLYSITNGTIYFSIPQIFHFGHENYFMLHLLQSLKNKAQNMSHNSLNIKILNQRKDGRIFEFNKQIDEIMKKQFEKNNIEIVNGFKIKTINSRNREIVSANGKTIQNYQALYQYLPTKIPQLLQQAKINPLQINHQTLINNTYPNLHVIGNIIPDKIPFTFYTMNRLVHFVIRNIINAELKSKRQLIYEGDSGLGFWTGDKTMKYFAFNENGIKSYNNVGQNKYMGRYLGWDKWLTGKYEIQKYYNGNSYGFPTYIFPYKPKQRLQSQNDGKRVQLNAKKI